MGRRIVPVLNDPKITNARVLDLRFPTSKHHIGSDAVNRDPDYSAAYASLRLTTAWRGMGSPSLSDGELSCAYLRFDIFRGLFAAVIYPR